MDTLLPRRLNFALQSPAVASSITHMSDTLHDEKKKKINGMTAAIKRDNRNIAALLKEKARLYMRIHMRLDSLRRAKISWTEKQIDSFAAFAASDRQKNAELTAVLELLKTRQNFKKIKYELLHNKVDYELVYVELAAIQASQQQALGCLKCMVDAGRGMLRLL